MVIFHDISLASGVSAMYPGLAVLEARWSTNSQLLYAVPCEISLWCTETHIVIPKVLRRAEYDLCWPM